MNRKHELPQLHELHELHQLSRITRTNMKKLAQSGGVDHARDKFRVVCVNSFHLHLTKTNW